MRIHEINNRKKERFAQFFKALSDETRLQIIALLLLEKDLCVCDIESILDVTQSKTSRHLRYLLHSGIIMDKREKVWVHYSIHPEMEPEFKPFIELFQSQLSDSYWDDLKDKLKQRLENKNSCKV